MSEAGLKLVRFNDFTGGESGTLFDRGAMNQWHGVNMQLYLNGTLGPRPGIKHQHTTAAIKNATTPTYYGARWVDAPDRSVATGYPNGFVLLYYLDGATYKCTTWEPYDGGTNTNTILTADWRTHGTKYQTQWNVSHPMVMDDVILHGEILFDLATASPTAISHVSSFAPHSSIWYRDRAYYWGGNAKPGRVYYSDAGDETAMTVGQYFDIGTEDKYDIKHFFQLKNTLTAYVSGAAETGRGEWWVMTGASPRTGTLRRIGGGRVPTNQWHAGILDDVIYWLQDDGRGVTTFDGAAVNDVQFAHLLPGGLGYDANTVIMQAIECPSMNSIALPYVNDATPDETTGRPQFYEGAGALEYINGTWCRSRWFNAVDPTNAAENYGVMYTQGFEEDKHIILTSKNKDGKTEQMEMMTRDVCLNRPGKADGTDDWSQNQDADINHATDPGSSTVQMKGELFFRELRSESGAHFTVRRVEVDVDYWYHSTVWGNAQIGLKLLYRNTDYTYGGNADELEVDISTASASADGWTSDSSEVPQRRTVVWKPGDYVPSGAVTVNLHTLRNVAIREIRVWIKEEPAGTVVGV